MSRAPVTDPEQAPLHDSAAGATDRALAHAAEHCEAHGARFTPARRRVLAILLGQGQPLTAYQLLDLLRDHQPGAQPPTVYRALDFLMRNELVHRIESTNSYLPCNHQHCGHHHPEGEHWPQFLLCDRCGETREVPLDSALRQALTRQAREYGFEVGARPLELHGLCPGCRDDDSPVREHAGLPEAKP